MTLRYVDPAASGAADGSSWTDAWTTMQTAADTATAGDIVYMRGTETLLAKIDVDTNSGSIASGLIRFVGCNSGGTVDGTRFVLDADNTASMCIDPGTKNLISFENIEMKNATGAGCDYTGCSSAPWYWINCYSHDNTGPGWDTYYAQYNGLHFYRCTSEANSIGWFAGYRHDQFSYCQAIGNTGAGWSLNPAGDISLFGCIAHGNGAGGIQVNGVSCYQVRIINSVIDGNTGDGIKSLNASNQLLLSGCRITHNTGWGINATGLVAHDHCYIDQNSSGTITGGLDVPVPFDADADTTETTGTVGYTNRGSDDWNLLGSATLRRMEIDLDGTNKFYITAGLPPDDTAGGGGTTFINTRRNSMIGR